jgi:CMP-N-acetylneuraminic acid synthetase
MEQPTFTALISIQHEAGYFLPDRHYRHFSGGPLFEIMVNKLLAIGQIERIVINTDSSRIRSSFGYNSKVRVVDGYHCPLNEPDLTSDKVTESILSLVEGEHFLQLGALFPFVKHNTLASGIDYYYRYVLDPEDGRHDSVFSIRGLNNRLFDSDNDVLRFDRPNTFLEDGIFHLFNRTTFAAQGNRKVGKKPFGFIVDEIENLPIDSEENYELAQLIDKNRHRFMRVFR